MKRKCEFGGWLFPLIGAEETGVGQGCRVRSSAFEESEGLRAEL